MSQMKFNPIKAQFTIAILISFSLLSACSLASAQERTTVRFTPPKLRNIGTPEGRPQGAASRSGCPDMEPPLTALLPDGDIHLTSEPYPGIWLYVPGFSESHKAEFIWQDDQDVNFYSQEIELSGEAGWVHLRAPEAPENALQLNTLYRWYFKIYCDSDNPQTYVYIDAPIQRSNTNDYPLEQRWYDLLPGSKPAQTDLPSSSFSLSQWNELLENTDLVDLRSAPFLNCCIAP